MPRIKLVTMLDRQHMVE